MERETRFNQIGIRREVATITGKAVTAYADGGVVSSEGSAADQRRDIAIFGDKVALFDRYVGLKEAEIVRKGGDFAKSQGRRASQGTLLSGLGSAFGSLGSMKIEGVI